MRTLEARKAEGEDNRDSVTSRREPANPHPGKSGNFESYETCSSICSRNGSDYVCYYPEMGSVNVGGNTFKCIRKGSRFSAL